jgi:hypothetical protein
MAILPLVSVLVGPPLVTPASVGSVPDPAVGQGVAAVVLAAILAAGVVGLTRWVPPVVSRLTVTAAGALSAAGGVVVIGRIAAPGSQAVTVAAAVVAALWGALVYTAHGADEPATATVLAGIPERDRVLRRGDATATAPQPQAGDTWQVVLRTPRMRALALFGAVVFGPSAWWSWGAGAAWWAVLVGAAGVVFCSVMMAWSSVMVRVDSTGLGVTSRVFPVRLLTVAPTDILGASSVEVDPMDWGGWGLRWSAGHTAVVLRGGPGLVVHRRSGRPLALEVPEGSRSAEAGADLLRRVGSQAQPS